MSGRAPSESDSEPDDDLEYMLGFAEVPAEPDEILRHRFPSKVGGAPAWLDPVHLPTKEQLTYAATGKALRFLLQVYAPLDDDRAHEEAFHRAIFLFVTPQGSKLSSPGALRALRCQLPRRNDFYSYHPAGPGDKKPPSLHVDEVAISLAKDPWRVLEREQEVVASLSAALQPSASQPAEAGTKAAAVSSSNQGDGQQGKEEGKGVDGTGEEGQNGQRGKGTALEPTAAPLGEEGDQKGASKEKGEGVGAGVKKEGGQGMGQGIKPGAAAAAEVGKKGGAGIFCFPEKELIVEPEEMETPEEEEAIKKIMTDYQTKVGEEGELSEEDLPEEVLDEVEANVSEERKHFAMFQARLGAFPDQCIRYCFKDGARALWPSPSSIPAAHQIPSCPLCGKARKFEFQVMPQLLNHLNQDELDTDSLDWGTLAVYSCTASCSTAKAQEKSGSAYVEEFVWVQPSDPASQA